MQFLESLNKGLYKKKVYFYYGTVNTFQIDSF